MAAADPVPSRRVKRSLHRQLVGLLLAVGLFPLIAMIGLSSNLLLPALNRQVEGSLEELAASSGDKLDRTLADRYGDVQALASSDGALAMDPLRILPLMARMTQIYSPFYRLMLVADSEGRLIAASRVRPDGSFLDSDGLLGQSALGEAWFEAWRSRALKRGTTFVEDVHADARVAGLYGDEGYVVGFSHGIFDQSGTLIGVWLSLVDWNSAQAIVSEFETRPHSQGAASVNLTIVSKEGLVLAGGAPDEILRARFDERRYPDHLLRRAASRGYRGFPSLGWTIIASQERGEALAIVNQLLRQTIIVAVVSGALVIGIGLLAARQLTRPMLALRQGAERIAGGDLRVSVPAGDDELGQVGAAFNSMTGQLRELYASLEEKVELRTTELAGSEARYRALLEQTQMALSETEALYGVTRSLIGFDSLTDVLQTVVDGVVDALGADAAALFTIDLIERRIGHSVAAGRFAERVTGISFDELLAGLTGWALRELKPALSPGTAPDPREDPTISERRRGSGTGSVIVVPLIYRDMPLGTLNAVNRLDQREFTQHDVELMVALANQAAVAIENVRLFEDAQRRAQEAETLQQAGAVVAAALRQDKAIDRILEQLARVIAYDSASVQLLRGGELEIVGGRGFANPGRVVGTRLPVPGPNPNTVVIQERQPHIVDDVGSVYPNFTAKNKPGSHVRSWLGVPLIVHDRILGLVTVDKLQACFFTTEHARLAAAFADHVAVTIENAHLFGAAQQELEERRRVEEALRQHQERLEEQVAARTAELQALAAQLSEKNRHLRNDITLARDIQLGLLPDEAPWDPRRLEAAGVSLPASEVGGDFFAYITPPDEQLAAVAIGDISGKGVGAALLMALVSSAIETHARNRLAPGELLTLLNAQLTPRLKANHMNAAVMLVQFDLERRLLRVANAGMIAPVLLRGGAMAYVDAYGLPLGSLPGAQYAEAQLALEPGDALVLVSDGIVEAHNAEQALFGFEGLEETLAGYRPGQRIEQPIHDLIIRVARFSGQVEQHDDMTIVVLRPHFDADTGSAA
ncbi:MAG TPA: SpoIIE family protein phosphatase [Herpetosiphonaceae bacterium]